MERYRVEVTEEAKADIRAAVRYLAVELREPNTAEKLLDSLEDEIASLERMPERWGCVRDEYLAALGIRMTAVKNYLLFYQADRAAHRVTVLRLLHGRREWVSILTEDHAGMNEKRGS